MHLPYWACVRALSVRATLSVVVFGDHDNSTSTKTSDHFHTTVQMLQKSEKIIAQIAWSRQISSLENGFTPCTLLDR